MRPESDDLPISNFRAFPIQSGMVHAHFICAILLGLIFWAPPAGGQEISVLGGFGGDSASKGSEVAWQIDYKQALSPHFAFSLSMLNEGQFNHNHRDGIAAQIWALVRFSRPRLSVGVGAGPYFFFDTNNRSGLQDAYVPYKNEHGVAAAVSFDADWYFSEPFFLKFRVNWVGSREGITTSSYLLGLGLQLDPAGPQSAEPGSAPRLNQFSVLAGRTIMNNRDSGQPIAGELEYRRRAGRYLEWSIAYLNEGDGDIFRNGIAAQLWGVREFYGGRLTLALGVGPYLAWNIHEDRYSGKSGETLAALVSAGIDVRLYGNWYLRGLWHRVVTDYSRDADVVLAGPGYRF